MKEKEHFFHPRICFTYFFLSLIIVSQAQQTPNRADYQLHIFETSEEITVDGLFEEAVWNKAEVSSQFWRVLPIDTGYATAKSTVRMTYDQNNLYLAIVFYDNAPGKRPVESLRRDFSFSKNDNFLLFMDTYNDQTNGFSFGASASGAQWDGIMSNGGSVSLDWDCKWLSATRNYEDRWVIEMGIPFRSIRYQEGITEWGINFSRLDLKLGEKSSWAPVPRQFPTASLAYTGTLVWDKAPPKAKSYVSLIPYISPRVSKSYQPNEDPKPGINAGVDAKIGLSPTLNLDLTLNPDFSQVEVDRQVTNLDRFELFFPERRRFFLENNTVFSNYGLPGVQPFFSRRIGLSSPVRAGLRLSGNLNPKWRVGLLNMQTGTEEEISAANFTMASIQRQIFSRSSIGAFVVNKELTVPPSDTTFAAARFNRVVGLDYNLASADNRWTGKLFFHKAFRPEEVDNAFATAAQLRYNTQQIALHYTQTWVGAGYRAETGFVRRNGFHQFNPIASYRFFPANRKVANHGPYAVLSAITDESFALTDRDIKIGYKLQWLDRSSFSAEVGNTFIRLLAPFDPTNTGGDTLTTGSEHQWQGGKITYTSTQRSLFTYTVSASYGGFYNGNLLSMNATVNYRVQPYGSLAIVAGFNRVNLPLPYNSADLILVGPRLDITFTDKLFLTTFVQYNNQIDNINLNMRFQWRYAPVSDLFIVYTDNYLPSPFSTKNRALVAKLSYWFN